MSIIITNGTVVLNLGKTSVALTKKDGPQTLDQEVEARLVSEGAAEYVDKPTAKTSSKRVATPHVAIKEPDAGENTPNKMAVPEGEETSVDKPQYSIEMKVVELREILEQCGLVYKVGMTKAAMVAALDEYFEEEADDDEQPPALGAAEPVI